LINLALHSLDGDEIEKLYVSTLRGMLLSWIGSKETYRSDIWDAFTYLLVTPEVGSYINRPDRYGATILHLAAKHPHVDSVKMLLEAGASADISLKLRDYFGLTPYTVGEKIFQRSNGKASCPLRKSFLNSIMREQVTISAESHLSI
jgi:ankyrin repeat protein